MESVLVFNESIYDDVILSPIYSFLRMSDECAALSQFPDNLLQYTAPVDTLKDFATLSLRNGESLFLTIYGKKLATKLYHFHVSVG